jgi:hypothetical protein
MFLVEHKSRECSRVHFVAELLQLSSQIVRTTVENPCQCIQAQFRRNTEANVSSYKLLLLGYPNIE